jgi:hypothetical protein
MQRLEVSGAVRYIYIYVIRWLKVNAWNIEHITQKERNFKFYIIW